MMAFGISAALVVGTGVPTERELANKELAVAAGNDFNIK